MTEFRLNCKTDTATIQGKHLIILLETGQFKGDKYVYKAIDIFDNAVYFVYKNDYGFYKLIGEV